MIRKLLLCGVIGSATLLSFAACSGGGGSGSALPPLQSRSVAAVTGSVSTAPAVTGVIQSVSSNQLNILGPGSCGYVDVNYTSSTPINLNGYSMSPGVIVNVWGSGSCATAFTATQLSLGKGSGTATTTPKPTATAQPTAPSTSAPAVTGTIQTVNSTQLNVLGPGSCGYVDVNYTSSTPINLNGYSMSPGVVVNVWGSGSCATAFTATQLSLGTPSAGTSSAAPKATATPTPQPTSVPTPKPTSVPTPDPPVSSGSYSDQNYLGIINGQEWPANFRPYCANAIPNSAAPCPWNDPLPDNPQQLYANSAAIVANMGSQVQLEADFSLSGDYSHPVYLASASDPVVNVTCTEYCTIKTASFRIPSAARPAGGSDQHMGIIEPDGTEWDMWKTSYSGGSTATAGIIAQTNILGSGAVSGGGATSGGALAAGLIRFDELSRGVIPHALFATTTCVSGSVVYPGGSQASVCTSGTGPPVGARLQLTLTDAQIDALSVLPWQKAIMHAMHDYGVYILDTSGGGSPGPVDMRWESQTEFEAFGRPYPGNTFAGLLSNIAGFDTALNWSQDLRIVSPCYAQETCTK